MFEASEARKRHKSEIQAEMEEVLARGDVVVGHELEQIPMRLPKEDLDALRRRVAKSGVGYTTPIRMIVRAHLNNPLTYQARGTLWGWSILRNHPNVTT